MQPVCRATPSSVLTIAFGALAALMLAACSRPPAPDPQGPPEPQASAMREAIAEPLDKAKDSSEATTDAQQKQDQAIEDATK